jgi:hypothetical protein
MKGKSSALFQVSMIRRLKTYLRPTSDDFGNGKLILKDFLPKISSAIAIFVASCDLRVDA